MQLHPPKPQLGMPTHVMLFFYPNLNFVHLTVWHSLGLFCVRFTSEAAVVLKSLHSCLHVTQHMTSQWNVLPDVTHALQQKLSQVKMLSCDVICQPTGVGQSHAYKHIQNTTPCSVNTVPALCVIILCFTRLTDAFVQSDLHLFNLW